LTTIARLCDHHHRVLDNPAQLWNLPFESVFDANGGISEITMEISIKWSMCRTCRKKGTELQSIFESDAQKLLASYAGLEVSALY